MSTQRLDPIRETAPPDADRGTIGTPDRPGAPHAAGWRHEITTDPTWNSWVGVHGGYLVAELTAGAAVLAPGQAVQSVHALFPRPITDGAALLSLHAERRGRGAAFMSGRAHSAGGQLAVIVQILTGLAGPGPAYPAAPAPEAPDPEGLEPYAFPVELVPFTQHLEIRPVSDSRPFAGGEVAELVAWVRHDVTDADQTQTLLILSDALPPALYAVMDAPLPIPSADLTLHLTSHAQRCDPADWFLVRMTTEFAADGWSIDAASVWDRSGQLLAVGRQSRRVLA